MTGGLFTFCRVYINPRLVEILLVVPVFVSLDGSEPVQQHQSCAQTQQCDLAASSPQPDVQGSCTSSNQYTEANTGDVKYPLCNNKTHVEEEVGGWDERQYQDAQRKEDQVFCRGQECLWGAVVESS